MICGTLRALESQAAPTVLLLFSGQQKSFDAGSVSRKFTSEI
jgi:hypothetical protein